MNAEEWPTAAPGSRTVSGLRQPHHHARRCFRAADDLFPFCFTRHLLQPAQHFAAAAAGLDRRRRGGRRLNSHRHGEIDLSIGSAVYLCSVVAAGLQTYYGAGTLETVAATILVGVALGAWQGAWVVAVSIPSFVVTLSGLLAFRGFGYWLSNAQTIAPVTKAFSALSEGFIDKATSYVMLAVVFALGAASIIAGYRRAAQEGRENAARTGLALIALIAAVGGLAWAFGGFLGIPEALIWVGVIGALLTGLMARTKFGRNAYLVGANREAAVLAGISLGQQLMLGFILMGFLYGVAGVS
jgi:D-xylose transport system permease protein